MDYDSTQASSDRHHFRTTRWSLISQIDNPCSPASQAALNALLGDYWKPVYIHLRKKGVDSERAKDLTQEFFYVALYERDLFTKAKRSRGRFRSFMLTALDRFLIDKNRFERAKKRQLYQEVLDSDLIESINVPDAYCSMSDQDSFDYAWTATMIENVSDQVREHFRSKGKAEYWELFDQRIKQPVVTDTAPPSLTQLCTKYGIADEMTASNMITTTKRAFRKALRTYVREYVYADADVDEELLQLSEFLRKKMQDSD